MTLARKMRAKNALLKGFAVLLVAACGKQPVLTRSEGYELRMTLR
jgi:hypothetical protein